MSILDSLTWAGVGDFLNSGFTSALAGALAGAFAGAISAQRIADRAKEREALVLEVRSINAAIMIAFTICNAGLALKRQFVKEMCEAFNSKKAELISMKEERSRRTLEVSSLFEFQADLRFLEMPLVPIDLLTTQLYEKISTIGRPLATVATLAGAIASLARAIERRNELIERFRKLSGEGDEVLVVQYFGLPYGRGHVNNEFSDTIESLDTLTDDLIFFSRLIANDLREYGMSIVKKHGSGAKLANASIVEVDFSEAESLNLMPSEEHYREWLNGFRNQTRGQV